MKCPRCVQVIHRGAGACPHCGFGILEADERYGSGEVVIRRLEDQAGLMRSSEREKVEVAMDRFEKRFPQLFFAVYTSRTEGRSDVRQFGFWLLNRAAIQDVDLDRPNECGILLTIDPDAKSAGITWGYALDAYLTAEDTFLFLSRAHAYWVEGRYSEGIVRGLKQLSKVLTKRCRQAKFDSDRFERRVAPPLPKRKVADRIRAGHRKTVKKEEASK
ncbi:TPM domain-containing protein [Haloferula sp.]|uniref:TPM domain-containing protein n=1 Tax=Haloferula sp. TaxID=2497595 RepID=UPI00329F474D